MRVIALEGINSAGKSSTGEAIKRGLAEINVSCRVIDPAGFGTVGAMLRERIVHPTFEGHPDIDAILFTALRAEGAQKIHKLEGEPTFTVVLERWSLAVSAYGTADGATPELLSELAAVLGRTLRPDVTVLLDVTGQIALKRLRTVAYRNRFELRGADYLSSVAEWYRHFARQMDRTQIVDANADPVTVLKKLNVVLTSVWPEYDNVNFER